MMRIIFCSCQIGPIATANAHRSKSAGKTCAPVAKPIGQQDQPAGVTMPRTMSISVFIRLLKASQ